MGAFGQELVCHTIEFSTFVERNSAWPRVAARGRAPEPYFGQELQLVCHTVEFSDRTAIVLNCYTLCRTATLPRETTRALRCIGAF